MTLIPVREEPAFDECPTCIHFRNHPDVCDACGCGEHYDEKEMTYREPKNRSTQRYRDIPEEWRWVDADYGDLFDE